MRPVSTSRNQSGFSLVEMMVVVIIIVIVATIALMNGGTANEQLKRQNIAVELKTAFERARFDSVKRRADTNGTWATVTVAETYFTVSTYENQGGTMTAVPVTTGLSGQNIVIAGYESQEVPVTIYFNQRGEPVDISGASVSPALLVCNGSCDSPTNSTANLLLVTPTGTVNLLPGGASLPTFGVPSQTIVPTNTGVNPDAVL